MFCASPEVSGLVHDRQSPGGICAGHPLILGLVIRSIEPLQQKPAIVQGGTVNPEYV
jgi:hypothetical protein